MKSKARLTAIGTYVPEKVLTNEDLQKLVDTSCEWIVQRTGLKERRVAGENEFASTLAIKAIQNLVERYGKKSDDVGHPFALWIRGRSDACRPIAAVEPLYPAKQS